MNSLLSQVSYPVFLYLTFLFFLMGSVFAFLVGLALTMRSEKALRFFEFMNRWVSVRKMMKPLSVPHYVEPTLLKRRIALGTAIIIGAMASVLLLKDTSLRPTLLLFDGSLTPYEMTGVAENLKIFLIVGNLICLLIGVLILISPRILAAVESYTDRWFTFRKSTLALGRMHMEIDCWVLKHPTSAGFTLSILSFSAGVLMFNQLQNLIS